MKQAGDGTLALHERRRFARRWLIYVLLAFCVFAPDAPAQLALPTEITGVYNGSYAGEQGPTKFKLSITAGQPLMTGVYTVNLPGSSGTNAYTCDLLGQYSEASHRFLWRSTKWETVPPSRGQVGMSGLFDPAGGQGAGQIAGTMFGRPAPEFTAIRDAAESANMASVIAAQKAAGPRAVSAAPVSPPTAVNGGDSAVDSRRTRRALPPPAATTTAAKSDNAPPASPAPAPAASGPTAINGVYTGNLQSTDVLTGVSGTSKLTFSIKSTDDGSLTGLFTFALPRKPGSIITYKLTGRYDAGAHDQWNISLEPYQFTTIEPVGSAAQDVPGVSKPKAVHISITRHGAIDGSLTVFTPEGGEFNYGHFIATKDRTESADLDKIMAAQASAGSSAAPAAAESANMPNLRLANNIRPGIQGVFNGTYTREKGPPTKFKLTIFRKFERDSPRSPVAHRIEGVIKGLATIYLPVGSGTKAYTYDLEGVETRDGPFHLNVHEWVTFPRPKDFENFRTMGFDGILVLDLTNNTARIVSHSSHQASHSWAVGYLPQFEATWDATESVDFRGAMEAQKAVGAEDRDAADKVYNDTVKNAPPKQLASKDLVRKSRAYWVDYQKDMLREVFDGGFGSDIDQDLLFEELFCMYVDLFSAKCRADLPAKHETVVVTRYRTSGDGHGGVSSVPEQSWTVEVDSRLAPQYRRFANSLGSPSAAQGLGGALGALSSGLSPHELMNEMLAPKRDMERFFATETGRSAAMRQLTENFLRGATGEPSLQQADGKIDGAAAETDKDLPPGRFARFVDGANAFYRDPANAKYKGRNDIIRNDIGLYAQTVLNNQPAANAKDKGLNDIGRNDTAFCQGLAVRYQFKMTPEEDYYYANDFKARFIDQIMQQHWEDCTDPEWPIFHPVVEECIAKFR